MLNVKCFYCGKSFVISPEVVTAWMEEHKEEKPRHYTVQCVFCRKAIKVPIKQIERGLPGTAAS
ncbi:MAG: hypothetical protein JW934_12995 [Anaerolineae bacterium]|nr:hypothetical protein [Anaerolineae bacterium]